jgi:hypothetical protein
MDHLIKKIHKKDFKKLLKILVILKYMLKNGLITLINMV